MRISVVLSQFGAILLVEAHCAISFADIWSELSTHEGEYDSHIVESSTQLTRSQVVRLYDAQNQWG